MTSFPAFITAEYDGSGNGFREFESAFEQSARSAEQRFTRVFDDIGAKIGKSLSRGLGSGGAIDLDVPGLRQVVADAKFSEQAFISLTRTASALAAETGDTSRATRDYIAALAAQTNEQQQAVRAAEAELATHTRLQAALDVTSDKQSRLAQAYRETFAEAAKAAQIEVNQLNASRAVGRQVAPAMSSRAIDNGAGYAALEQAARAADVYEKELADLRAQLDPLAAEQARLNAQLAIAAEALRKGDITAEQYQVRVQQLNATMDASAEASGRVRAGYASLNFQLQDIFQGIAMGVSPFTILAQQGGQLASALADIAAASKPVSSATASAASAVTGLNTATAAAKSSTLQLAAADVAAVPATNSLSAAARVETGALSGVAAAAAGAAAATNSLTTASRLATFAAGPYGAALIAAVSVLGMFALSSRKAGEETDKAKRSTLDFTDVLEYRAMSVTKFTEAINQLNASTEQLISTQARLADFTLANAQAQVADLDRRIAEIGKQISDLGPERTSGQVMARGFDVSTEAARARLTREYSDLVRQREVAMGSVTTAQIALAQRAVDELTDASAKLKGEYDRAIVDLTLRRQRSARSETTIGAEQPSDYISKEQYDRRILELKREYDRNAKVLKDSERTTTPRRTAQQVLGEFIKELEAQGIDVISSYRSAAKQNSLYKQGLTPLDGYSRPSPHQAYRAVDVDKNTLNEQAAYAAAQKVGLKGFQIVTESGGRKHFQWKGHGAPGEVDYQSAQRAAERAQREAAELQRAIDSAAESVSRLRGQFDEAPRDVDRATAAVIDLNQAIAQADAKLKAGGLTDEQKKVIEQTRDSAITTRDTLIPQFLKRPLTDELNEMRELVAAQDVMLNSGQAEYEVRSDMLDLARLLGAETLDQLAAQIQLRGITDDQVKAYGDMRRELRLQNIELEQQRERQQQLLQIVDDVASTTKNAIYDLFDGRGLGAAKSFLKGIFEVQKQALTEDVYEALFGEAFRQQKLKILGLDKVDEAGRDMARAIRQTIGPIEELGAAVSDAVADIRGAANDNTPTVQTAEIVVTAQKSVQRELKDTLKALGDKILGPDLSASIGDAVGSALRGAAVGQAASGILRDLGIKQSKLGSQIGGAIGSFLPIPGGDIIGGAIGGTIGGLFKKTPKGSATITGIDDDPAYRGSGKLRAGVTDMAGGVQAQLARIADALGAEIGSFRVSIGQRKKSFVVDPTGQGRTKGAGVQKYASEEEAAYAALRDALLDGAVQGLRAGSQRLLQAGKDIDVALQKALDFQSVFDRLKQRDDPVGAALDTLDREFTRLKKIFAEAGATTEEYAELERLYGIERAEAVKEAAERMTASLKSLYDDLTMGDNGRSLRDRLGAAQAAYDPLKARVAAGDRSAYDAYAEAAKALLDIQREFSGSQTPYFELLDEITQLTKLRIDAETNIASIAAGRDSPFTSTGQASNNYAPVVGAIENQTQQLLQGWAVMMGQWQQYNGVGGFTTQRFGTL